MRLLVIFALLFVSCATAFGQTVDPSTATSIPVTPHVSLSADNHAQWRWLFALVERVSALEAQANDTTVVIIEGTADIRVTFEVDPTLEGNEVEDAPQELASWASPPAAPAVEMEHFCVEFAFGAGLGAQWRTYWGDNERSGLGVYTGTLTATYKHLRLLGDAQGAFQWAKGDGGHRVSGEYLLMSGAAAYQLPLNPNIKGDDAFAYLGLGAIGGWNVPDRWSGGYAPSVVLGMGGTAGGLFVTYDVFASLGGNVVNGRGQDAFNVFGGRVTARQKKGRYSDLAVALGLTNMRWGGKKEVTTASLSLLYNL